MGELGDRLAKCGTAEVFAWQASRVIKLIRRPFAHSARIGSASREEIERSLPRSSAPSPRAPSATLSPSSRAWTVRQTRVISDDYFCRQEWLTSLSPH